MRGPARPAYDAAVPRLRDLVALVGICCALACPSSAPPGGTLAEDAPTTALENEMPAPDSARAIPIEEVARYPLPGTAKLPSMIRADPSGTLVSYLFSEDGTLTRQLFAHDPRTGQRTPLFSPPGEGTTEDNISLEEKLRRERLRERGLGITSYAWAKQRNRVLVPLRGEVWIQDGIHGEPRKLAAQGGHPCIDPQITRDGAHVAWVQDDELYTVSVDEAGAQPQQITSGARGSGRTHGLAEYIAQEEMDRHHGFWWNHAGDAIAYTEVDETAIPIWRITHLADGTPSWEDHRYPFAGADNAKVKLGVVPRGGGQTVWMDLATPGEPEGYLARVHWTPAGELLAQLEDRAQKRLQLVRFDLATGARELVLEERSEIWINLANMFEPLENGEGELAGAFVWGSERDGFRHLYLVGRDGKTIRQLTSGAWIVDDLVGVDEARGEVYFMGSKDGPTERHLYRVALAGGEIERLTTAPGMHGVTMDAGRTVFIDTYSSVNAPPQVEIHMAHGGELVHRIAIPSDPRIDELGLTPPELVTLTNRVGDTLHGAVYRPAGAGPWPVIVSVYGGPHAQRVTNGWDLTVDMRAQYLRGLGFLVFKLDNRGSARRGLAFEGAIARNLGDVEIRDQQDGVRWLVERGLADPERVGIYGWSYGGYMAAMALARAPETFKVGIAGAMVSSWDGYDTHYTERYMGTPKDNPEGYAASSVMTHVQGLTGHLMIVHGGNDENVHFRHGARFIDALNKARKPYELLMFPSERHLPRGEADRVYMEERMRDFFREHLTP
ncbi:MAG: S9 family peptidase [Deltaproteobacteria bacterium]|nr:S9 family peptidase [Nannocystaceae bacterium]